MRISDWSSDVCSSDLAGHTRQLDRVLKRQEKARDRALLRLEFQEVDAIELDLAVRHLVTRPPGKGVGERGFAGAVRPHDGVHLAAADLQVDPVQDRSEEHTSELQSLMRISYAVFCLKKKTKRTNITRAH